MIYILTWLTQDQLSTRDEEGYTAMHLAIKSSHKLENSRTVRVLLYHGAPTNIRDQNGFTALDLANNLEDSRIKLEIIKLLTHRTGLIEFLQYRNPLKKVSRSWKLPIAYVGFNVYIYLISALFTAPIWAAPFEIWIVLISFAVSTLFWLITMNKDPGFIKPYPQVDFLELLQLIDPIQLCPDCLIVRTPRSKHCAVCNRCVERFDHHCPWINNCVGRQNFCMFFLFIVVIRVR